MKKSLFFTLIALMSTLCASAQISFGGTPPSFEYSNLLRSTKKKQVQVSSVTLNKDIDALKREDAIARTIAAPARIAIPLAVEANLENTGSWTDLPNGQKIWQQTIAAKGADALILRYSDFFIPQGASLFIYNKNKTQTLGAYTYETNPNGGKFSNEMLLGDTITLEYVVSTVSNERPRISVADVGYVYNLKEIYNAAAVDLSCMVNINCDEGANWQNQKRGIVSISMYFPGEGWYVCSGSLVNNTTQDGTPYLLTAHHCFYDGSTTAEFTTAQFSFNYENSTCYNTNATEKYVLTGSDMKVNIPISGASDGLLLQLKNAIPSNYNAYFNGWDVSGNISSNGVVIHHPAGIAKKISTYIEKPTSSRWYEGTCVGCSNGASNAHWKVYYASTLNGQSVTAGGSSGSPLFNSAGLIVGTLTGGSSYCKETYEDGSLIGGPNYADWYGKLWYHWSQSATANQRMKTYLDPLNLNVTTLKGYDPNNPSSIDSEKAGVNIVMFPNPMESELNVNTRGIIKSISIVDMNGRSSVYELNDHKLSTISIPVSDLAKGVYTIVVKTEEGQFSDKIVKK